MTVSQKRKNILRVAVIGLMAALVYAGNYLQIPLPGETRIHLGNSMCLLAGLLFGGVSGGLSSGIGAALYDLFDPRFITSAPYTFFSKFAMGWVAGFLNRKSCSNTVKTFIAAICGQLTYIILYLGKSLISQLILGNPFETAFSVMLTKTAASFTNGAAAVIISVPLYFALKKALSHTAIASFINGSKNTPEEG